MTERKVRLALAQMECALADVHSNLDKVEAWIKEAAASGANIICFPELCLTGYNLMLLKEQVATLSQDYSEMIARRLSAATKAAGIYAIVPIGVVDDNEKLYNRAFLYGPDGSVVGTFDKLHAFALEKNYFSSGDQFPVFDLPFAKIGILICYDVGFPETARRLMDNGAELIFVPAAWRVQDTRAWMLNIPSRALENQLFTVGVNRVGMEGDLHLFGQSMVSSPSGENLALLPQDSESLSFVDIDLAEVEVTREAGGYLQDRKPWLS